MSFLSFLKGGVKAPHRKNTAECETVAMPTPKQVVLSMAQHIGPPCKPTVAVGDTVAIGQIVGDSEAYLSAPVHATVSGTVSAITEIQMPAGHRVQAVVIDSDGEDRVFEGVTPPTVETFDEFLKAVRASGLVGLGGAGFPTHVKLNPKNRDEIDTIIINAAECEPYITADYRECMENSWDIVSGVQAVMEFVGATRVIIAVEANKPLAIEELSAIAAKVSEPSREVIVKTLPARYPQGAEKVLIAQTTGRKVPPGALPADVGCIVLNVTSVAVLSRYLKTGMPLVKKRLTVDGSAVGEPKNVCVALGTPIAELLAFCKADESPAKILMGGPMMGTALKDASLPILKQNNAILAMNEDDAALPEPTACIRCGKCVAACPMSLTPPAVAAAFKAKDAALLEKRGVMVCMECGCCAYACPANRPIVQMMRQAKGVVRAAQQEKKKEG
ncbi:MAG: electron transport complex subunit RsxC [Clostridia bacterium]|nr:electron transport complex subunit RsxC [Clostridia bacterium]